MNRDMIKAKYLIIFQRTTLLYRSLKQLLPIVLTIKAQAINNKPLIKLFNF